MDKKNSRRAVLPVLFAFFVMGFCDIVGISSDYAASAFGWSATMAGLIPSVVFVWFFLLGVPFGVMMNRLGRKNTVLLSMLITVVGMVLPLIHYDSTMTLVAYALLGIGNAILQESVNPLLRMPLPPAWWPRHCWSSAATWTAGEDSSIAMPPSACWPTSAVSAIRAATRTSVSCCTPRAIILPAAR